MEPGCGYQVFCNLPGPPEVTQIALIAEDYDELFTDGWRDPGDDCERGMVYLMAVVAIPFGVFAIWFGQSLLRGRQFDHGKPLSIWFGILSLALGLLFSIWSVLFLRRESRYWNLRRMTLERFVAGGFLLGVSVMLFGLELQSQGASPASLLGGVWCFGVGLADLLLFLIVGLLCALLPQLTNRRRILSGAYVVSRFVIDDKGMNAGDASLPLQTSFLPYVSLRIEGKTVEMSATPSAYELALPGSIGEAETRGNRLTHFRIKRRSAAPPTTTPRAAPAPRYRL